MGIFNRDGADRERLRDRVQNVREAVQSGGASIGVGLVMDVANGAADIVDRFIQNPAEKQEALLALREFELEEKSVAMEADAAILADRQSARAMAGTHGKLQTSFAMTFLISFLLLLAGEFTFVGLIISWEMKGELVLSSWVQALISGMLTGVLAYMVSMLKEVVGFLFGGSAGGDDREANLTETLRNVGTQNGSE